MINPRTKRSLRLACLVTPDSTATRLHDLQCSSGSYCCCCCSFSGIDSATVSMQTANGLFSVRSSHSPAVQGSCHQGSSLNNPKSLGCLSIRLADIIAGQKLGTRWIKAVGIRCRLLKSVLSMVKWSVQCLTLPLQVSSLDSRQSRMYRQSLDARGSPWEGVHTRMLLTAHQTPT